MTGQQVEVRVTADSGGLGVPGAITRMYDRSGALVAEGLTADNGRVLLKGRPGAGFKVRVDAIGFRRNESPGFEVPERGILRVVVPVLPAPLLGESEAAPVSERIAPVETEAGARIVRAALAASGTAAPGAFGGVSDLYHVPDVPGVVLGPGRSEQSHAADEWIETDQLKRGVEVYVATIERYFEGAPGA